MTKMKIDTRAPRDRIKIYKLNISFNSCNNCILSPHKSNSLRTKFITKPKHRVPSSAWRIVNEKGAKVSRVENSLIAKSINSLISLMIIPSEYLKLIAILT